MPAVTIVSESADDSKPQFRAIAGSHHSVGRTAGEALDSLLAKEGKAIDSSMIVIQRFAPDAYFSQAQHDRMRELLDRRSNLSADEETELDNLIDEELSATLKRIQPARMSKPA